ncbi:hypothetical protein L2E82_46452 [Cichorium intybus]|uniref:Uncharacterized protein n=1 Tax=Cichorium intybus TaxID=13427 RepID=A0ACB8YTR2_CICIN|nr:hypothetical protein L2E82_46452 [Cichorium intybus]
MLKKRMEAYDIFRQMKVPKWSDNVYPKIDFKNICYYSEPKKKPTLNSLDEADPEYIKYYDRLGIPLSEKNRLANVAVDAVLDSVSIATTHRKTLEKSGVIFCSISEAIKEHPDLVKKYLGRVVHAAVVELYAHKGAEIKYSTVQNWYAGDENGRGRIYNFLPKRGLCAGRKSKISWTQVETGSAITWKYPSIVLEGDDSVGEFYSVTLTNNRQQADTGTKMIHKGKNTKSRIISKGISAGNSRNCFRGLVHFQSRADNARYSSQCDSMLIGDKAAANTYPYIQAKNPSARIEHEASTSKIGEDQLFYFQQRGIGNERAMAAMVSGYCRDVFNKLPDEFGAEVNQLMSLKLENSVG